MHVKTLRDPEEDQQKVWGDEREVQKGEEGGGQVLSRDIQVEHRKHEKDYLLRRGEVFGAGGLLRVHWNRNWKKGIRLWKQRGKSLTGRCLHSLVRILQFQVSLAVQKQEDCGQFVFNKSVFSP